MFIQEKIATKEAELVNYEQSIESVREKIKVKVAEIQDQNSSLQVKHLMGVLQRILTSECRL